MMMIQHKKQRTMQQEELHITQRSRDRFKKNIVKAGRSPLRESHTPSTQIMPSNIDAVYFAEEQSKTFSIKEKDTSSKRYSCFKSCMFFLRKTSSFNKLFRQGN